MSQISDRFSRMRGLIVSCQPVPDGPLDTVEAIVAFALAAQAAGALGLRIEGARNVAAVVKASRLPVIGLVKRDLADSAVRITPFVDDVAALVEAGAAIVAVDATDRALLDDIWESNNLLRHYLGTPDNPELIVYRILPSRVRYMREWALDYFEVPL